ncbi:DUF3883 domain-containing protein [Hoeflea sp. CAU 1731]
MANEDISGKDWNDWEIDLIVADYFAMLHLELAGQSYVKSKRNEALQKLIGRSKGSIEFKHQNISAVLDTLGKPQIKGYKPRYNFQGALIDGVERYLDQNTEYFLNTYIDKHAFEEGEALYYDPPPNLTQHETPRALSRLIRKFDPAVRDSKNRELGLKGEEHVFLSEQARLRALDRSDLARKMQWVSQELGDGAGYDILSFDARNGEKRFLEVKTTMGGNKTPFFISSNEKLFCEENPNRSRIVRLFDFASKPRAFEIAPPLENSLILNPANYKASFD